MTSRTKGSNRLLGGLLVAIVMTAGACAGTNKQGSTADGKRSRDSSNQLPPTSIGRATTTAAPGGSPMAAVEPASKGSDVARPGAYAVGALHETYIDSSRKTPRNGAAPEKPQRTLPTLVLYPARGSPGFETSTDNAKPQAGPWPLVVFSHGVTGKGADYATTLRVLASAGYVVVVPDYPLSKRDAEGGPSVADVAEQTRDVAFLINRALAASKHAGGPLTRLIDPGRIGLAGHSLGAITSLGAGYNACCEDRRVKAVAEWAGIFFPLESNRKVAPSSKGRPLLIVHGDQDPRVKYSFGQAVYRLLGPPKYFITLPGATHVLAYIQGVGTPQSKVVVLSTVDFFDRYLKGDKTGIDRLHQLVADAGRTVATEQEKVA